MKKWDTVYSQSDEEGLRPPSASLVKFLHRLPRGKALDLACGTGRNALFLAGKGFDVDAVDNSSVAIEKSRAFAEEAGLKINFICADLTSYKINPQTYDLIICYYYLDRSLAPQIIKGLKKGGALLFETYTEMQKSIGPPSNADYLLGMNELPHLFRELQAHHYREGIFTENNRRKGIATLIARRRA
ncbi:MAG: class I SAM-dependent methyltransferase [Deltaproteobacteria bacterium]|nr:class I SAM-dependent methyltransferase [Deltaproteobacteria bacterium]